LFLEEKLTGSFVWHGRQALDNCTATTTTASATAAAWGNFGKSG
jgi:hypothetical protein